MGTAKVKSGSKVGKVQYPYDAMVYIDGTVIRAIDKDGNTIRRGVAGTDDVEVIQAAITTIVSGIVFIKKGNYVINNAITLISNIGLIGESKTETVLTAGTCANILYGANTELFDVLISNFTLDGNNTSALINIALTPHDGSRWNTNIEYNNLITRNPLNHSIPMWDTSHGIIRDCIGENSALNGLDIQYSKYIIAENNEIYNCSGYGIDIGGSGAIHYIGNHRILNNYIYNTEYGCVISTANHRCVFDGNTVDTVINASYPGIQVSSTQNNVSRNRISNCVQYGINIAGGYNTISENEVYDCYNGIVVTSNKNGVNANNCYSNQYNGIYVSNCSYNEIFENKCYNNGDAGIGYGSGIRLRTSGLNYTSFNSIYGNICFDDSGSSIQDVGIYIDSANCTNNLIVGNIIFGNSIFQIYASGTNCINENVGYIHASEIRDVLDNTLESLGTPRLLCPCVEITGTSITDYTRLSNTLTAQASVATWYGYLGRATYYDFDGTAKYLYRANDTDFDFGNSLTDNAFSIVCCVYADAVASRQIIGKWDVNNLREWRFFLDASGYPTLQLYDESIDKYIGRQDQTALVTTGWIVLVATYDGSGICAGCKVYLDGVQVDDADYTDAGYVAMEAINTNLMVGALKNAAAYSEYFDGKMTWIGVAAKELSADEVWSLTQRLKGVLGI